MKYLIGVVGENGAGKDTFTSFLTAAVAPLSTSKLRFSDVLYETLSLWGISPTRANLQNLAIIMDREFGKGSVTKATNARISSDAADIVIVEGVRWKTDVPMIRSFKNNFLVYVTARPELRFERMQKRGEKKNERKITREQFEHEEKAGTEVEIPQIAKTADVCLENNGTLDEFRKKVEGLTQNLKLET